MLPSTDTDIRSALHRKWLRQLHDRPDTIVVNELGLAHANVGSLVCLAKGQAARSYGGNQELKP